MSPLVEAVSEALRAVGAQDDCDLLARVAAEAVVDFVKEPTLHQRLYALLNADA